MTVPIAKTRTQANFLLLFEQYASQVTNNLQ